MNDQDIGADRTDEAAAGEHVVEHLAELAARAREVCAGRPELLGVLERLDALDRVDLAHRPAELDAVHRVLREALANAGREDAAPTP